MTITIRRNSDGVTKAIPWRKEYYSEFDWMENNHSCDCNRAALFNGSDIPCSHGLFSVRVQGDDGSIVYDEIPNET